MHLSLKKLATVALATPLMLSATLTLSAAPAQAQPAASARGLPDFTDLVEQVGPAVVNIRTTARAHTGNIVPDGIEDEEMQELLRRFFGMPLPGVPRGGQRQNPQQPESESVPRGVGSGFILSTDGYVMTNAHVIADADDVLVTLPDQREFKARVIGADKRTDVAVVKIDANGLPSVRIGDTARLKVGEWVMAIGSPFGLENSVTAGIVSAKQRDTGDYLPFIQTDVAVNPGNSGGPLINMRGEVVGINSQIYSRSGGFMGISFAIPIEEAMRVSEQLRAHGHVTRGRIGVQIAEVTRDVAESLGLGKTRGALVRAVENGSPADKAGVEAGDIILKFDGQAINKMSDLPRLVGNTRPGARAALTVLRQGQQRDLHITVAELDADSTTKRPSTHSGEPANVGKALGLTVTDLTDAQKQNGKLRHGVRVQAVADAAARAGLREGDIVLAVANVKIHNVREFEAAVAKTDRSKPVNMLVQRGELVQFVLVRPAH